MGFQTFASPYDWSRVSKYREIARQAEGGCIDISVGSPADEVPQSVVEALRDAATAPNAYGYPATVGTQALQNAISRWFMREREVDLSAIHAVTIPTVGSKEAVALMASLLHLGAGDVVVQPAVSYPTYAIGTQIAGAEVLEVSDVADVDSWRNVAGVKAVWVNSPSNPTGEIIDSEALAGIVRAARSIGAVVLSDECYALMRWDEADSDATQYADAPSILRTDICQGTAQGVLALYSLSKQSNMAGYRAAFVAGDAAILKEMTAYRKQIGQIIPGPVQAAMAAALDDAEAVHVQWRRYYRRLSALVQALQAYGYEVLMPQGALYVWAKARSGNCWQDMEDLAALGIVPSPGEFYGAPEYLRFSATASDEDISTVAKRLHEAASSK